MDKGVDKEAYIYGSEAYEPRKKFGLSSPMLIFVTTTVAEKIQISGMPWSPNTDCNPILLALFLFAPSSWIALGIAATEDLNIEEEKYDENMI